LGETLGGPIRRNKTFFFGTYSGLRQITDSFLTGAVVPTALERQGNFSASSPKPTTRVTAMRRSPGGSSLPPGWIRQR